MFFDNGLRYVPSDGGNILTFIYIQVKYFSYKKQRTFCDAAISVFFMRRVTPFKGSYSLEKYTSMKSRYIFWAAFYLFISEHSIFISATTSIANRSNVYCLYSWGICVFSMVLRIFWEYLTEFSFDSEGEQNFNVHFSMHSLERARKANVQRRKYLILQCM